MNTLSHYFHKKECAAAQWRTLFLPFISVFMTFTTPQWVDRLRLPFQSFPHFRREVFKITGVYPHHLEFYRVAFTHRSAQFTDKEGKSYNNERLEFLGDAVLETVVSDILYHHFPSKREGFMTSTRSKVVQRTTLNRLAEEMGIKALLHLNMPVAYDDKNNLGGNAFEALMGALYLDRGYTVCYHFVARQVLGKHLNLDEIAKKEENFKSQLLEWCQKNKVQIEFFSRETPVQTAQKTEFHTILHLEGIDIGEGRGKSKKESHQLAAKETIRQLKKNPKVKAMVLSARDKRESNTN